jgi:hypothetical protein
MSIIKFIKSLFAKRNEHVKSVEKIDKEIANVLYKVEPQGTAVVVEEKPKKAKPKKKKPAKKKTNEPK